MPPGWTPRRPPRGSDAPRHIQTGTGLIHRSALVRVLRRLAPRPDDRPMNIKVQVEGEPEPTAGSGLTGKTKDLGGYQVEVAPQELSEEGEALAYAEAALGRVTSRLGDASQELNYIVGVLEYEGDDSQQLRDAQEVLSQIQSVEATLRRILRRGRDQESGDAFLVVAQYSALISDAEAAQARLPGPGPGGGGPPDSPGPWRRRWDAVVAHIKAALPHLWAFISRLVTPTQWTVEGNVGTGIFGFAGASISVTFGKAD